MAEEKGCYAFTWFQKFFITQCDKANINFTVREYLSGHQLPNMDASYIRTTEEDRLAEYVKAIDFLTVNPTKRLQEKVQELESEQAQEIAQLRAEIKAWEPIKNELLEMAKEMGIKKKMQDQSLIAAAVVVGRR